MGLDLASKGDLNAVVYLFPEDGGTYALFADFFLPEDALESTQNVDIVPGVGFRRLDHAHARRDGRLRHH